MSAQLESMIRAIDNGTYRMGPSAPAARPAEADLRNVVRGIAANLTRIRTVLGDTISLESETVDREGITRMADRLEQQAAKLRAALDRY